MAERLRPWCLGAAVVVLVAAVVPPVLTEARRYEFVQAVQFVLLALALPALVVLGAPWARLRLAARPGDEPRLLDRWAAARARHPELRRALAFLLPELAVVVAWRTPGAVDALSRHPWLLAVEAATLAAAGVGSWLELVPSPPLAPRTPRPWRAVQAAVAMWLVWILAYALGFSRVSWFHAYHHAGGLSTSADQQITTAVLWLSAAAAFLPVVFWDLLQWLKHDDDPDTELYRLVRSERRAEVRRTPPQDGTQGRAS
ncbi:MAG: cytochrome c oxidase assembly protein [Acidimicrobiales bacterium]